ncbi:DMT family transporter [Aliidiomarina quisquiliarum]|uniref:DMT family transporter n=1 Tax=Aliidiomarina quisquiliarum TaxID=2938947 RepID=UPI00208ECE36|nr:DMT family transporter [Aliidiomarina quisquiliarum]MCO4320899.1 DMT family transporter [Aliidiomarina quisquiliarum]
MSLYLGQLAALTAAFCWAIATIFYSKSSHHLSSIQLNLVKGIVASPLLLLGTLLLPGEGWAGWSQHTWLLMTLSGVIGITIGDSCYFAALRRLGPGHTILLEYLAPPMAAVLAWLVLSEALSPIQMVAAVTVIAGVLLVLTERQLNSRMAISRAGVLYAVSAAACQAIGLVMAFYGFSQAKVSPAEAALVRLFGGTLILTVGIVLLRPKLFPATLTALKHTQLSTLLAAIALGTFLGIWLQQVAVALVTPGIAQTLLSTAPLFMLSLNVIRGQHISFRAVTGTVVAMAGISLLFLF